MKNLFLAAAVCTALIGCRHSVDGDLTATETITLNKKNGEAVTLAAGQYEASFANELKKGELKLKVKVPNAKDVSAVFKAPEMLIPQNGEIKVAAATSSQPWDLTAKITTETTEGQKYKAYESCRTDRPYYTCYWYPSGRYCSWWYDTYWYGTREVEFHYETTTRQVNVTLADPADADVVATFTGDKKQTVDVVYDYIGSCF